jgi:uncharacterized protein YegJ (DUF2314 family)
MIGIVLRRVLGVVALFMGVSLFVWFVYNQFSPTPQFQRGFRSVFQLIIPTVFVIYGWRWFRYEGQGIQETPGTFNFPGLVESVARARSTLPYFISQVEENIDGAYIKFPMSTKQELTEHIWAYVHTYPDGKFNVSLANAPIDPEEKAQGRRDIPQDEVEDWQIMQSDGRIKGAYSTIALFRNRQSQGKWLSPKMRKQKALLVDFPE